MTLHCVAFVTFDAYSFQKKLKRIRRKQLIFIDDPSENVNAATSCASPERTP
jgi:hypothetical protein